MERATGYGPRSRLYFDGDETRYELWEVKFLGYMKLQKLLDVIVKPAGEREEDAPTRDKLSEAFAELVQFLDDRSLSLVIRDAKDDGRKALQMLRDHYSGRGKPRIIALYTELTTLKMGQTETVTDYVIRAETAANALKMAGETISDSLLIAMVLKGLTEEFETFVTVIGQQKQPGTFAEFKIALRNCEEQERSRRRENSHIMKVSSPAGNGQIRCFSCGEMGHKSFECSNKSSDRNEEKFRRRWCSNCRVSSHDTRYCRKSGKDHVKTACDEDDDDHSFVFKICDNENFNVCASLLVDGGATAHIINDQSKFVKFDDKFICEDHLIELADGSRQSGIVKGKGLASIPIYDVNGNVHEMLLHDALYVPSYSQNIMSVHAATQEGATVSFGPNIAEMSNNGAKFEMEKKGRLYYLKKCGEVGRSLEEWHKILGHCNLQDVLKLESVVKGMSISNRKFSDCETCTLGKMIQYRNRAPDRRASSPLELVHSDLAGPVDPPARDGFRYAISFVDDYSGAIFVYFLRQKSDASRALAKFLADTSQYGSVKRLRSDNGGEFLSTEFEELLVKSHIKHEMSAPYSPHQNGTAERAWRSLFEMARCLLLESNLPKSLWTYAVMTATQIRNRCYNSRTGKTPYESLTGIKPNLSGMHIFGTVCYAYEQNQRKLDPRCTKGVFVGYDKYSPAYLVYLPTRGTVKKVRCVKFTDKFPTEEPSKWMYDIGERQYGGENGVENADENADENLVEAAENIDENLVNDDENNVGEHFENAENVDENLLNDVANDSEERRYPVRLHRKPGYLNEYVTDVNCVVDYCYNIATDAPVNYHEAVGSTESTKWQTAMEEEIAALQENETFELTSLPEGQSLVGGKWVYAIKSKPDGGERHKARYVAKGYSQRKGVDFHETFAPTAQMTSVRLLMQIAAQYDMQLHQMDVKTAYLHAPIDCEIYMEQPEGFEITSHTEEKLVWRLRKSLYGLKQSGRMWNSLLHEQLLEMGFEQNAVDHCLYMKCIQGDKMFVLVWVDDLIVAGKNEDLLNDVKQMLKERFKMKDLGKLSCFLGIDFEQGEGFVKMSQRRYIDKILERFGMKDCKPRYTPSEQKIECASEIPGDSRYRQAVGSLIYAMTCTRPDICWTVTKLSQYLSSPAQEHWIAVKHVLRYLKGTQDYELCYQKHESELKLVGYSDADWASNEERRSTTGYCFSLSEEGPLISWKSKRQQTVALSSCEAEYMALAASVQESIYLRQMLDELDVGCIVKPVVIFEDNQGAIALAKNPIKHQRSKHIDIRYHFIRAELDGGRVEVKYCPTEDMVADIMTKPATRHKLEKFKKHLFN